MMLRQTVFQRILDMPFNATTLGTATLGSFAGSTFTDTFDVGGSEVNFVAIDLTEGRFYEIDIDSIASGDFFLRIFDQFGVEVRGNDDGFFSADNSVVSVNPYLRFTPNYTGRYYVALSPWYLDSYDPNTTAGRVGGENPLALTAGTLIVNDIGNSVWSSAAAINQIVTESSSDLTDMVRDEDRSNRVELIGAIDQTTDVDIMRVDLTKGDVIVVDVNGVLTGSTTATVIRVFDDTGAQVGFDDDSGVGDDPELIYNAPNTDDFYIGISADGNSVYNGLDGTGTVAGLGTGSFEIIIHRNPTQIGSTIANTINGDATANYIVSLGGNDTLNGNGGRDTLAGGDNEDSILGGDGEDVLYGEHGNDILRGDKDSDVLSGGLGNDTLDGGAGADLLTGGAGNDTLKGGGGASNDTLYGDDGNDNLSGFKGNDTLYGGLGLDTMLGEIGDDSLYGGGDADSMSGGDDSDFLIGDTGNDTLRGDAGNDTLYGGDGADSLVGGGGHDVLAGGAGNDTVTGNGDDTFFFGFLSEGIDTITDFSSASALEFIDLSLIFFSVGSVVNAGNLAQFIQVTPAGAGADCFLAVDDNGFTGGSSFTTIALVTGNTAAQLFDAANFIL
jgi:Ca2+-binding RTX toxin-like protein